MSRVLTVEYENRPCYEIHLMQDFSGLVPLLQKLGYQQERRICIVTDSNVGPLYAKELEDLLKAAYPNCFTFLFPAGEAHKHTGTVGDVYEFLIRHSFDRKDLLLALGGGVVGDLTGFTAATYLRGIDFVQVPTTLLSQVDSSIGGKTGVDHMQYKNMVGAFYMPRLVYMNLSLLKSLPGEQFASGMGEILKHGQIKNADYFSRITKQYEQIQAMEFSALEEMIYGSCLIKRQVVQDDPREQGEPALLNFGHTVGHAIEKLSNFSLLHGECVALGVVSAAYLSITYGSYDEKDFLQLKDTLIRFCLPTILKNPSFSPEDVLAATKLDKKMDAGKIKFILLKEPGSAYITRELTDEQILEGIRSLFH